MRQEVVWAREGMKGNKAGPPEAPREPQPRKGVGLALPEHKKAPEAPTSGESHSPDHLVKVSIVALSGVRTELRLRPTSTLRDLVTCYCQVGMTRHSSGLIKFGGSRPFCPDRVTILQRGKAITNTTQRRLTEIEWNTTLRECGIKDGDCLHQTPILQTAAAWRLLQ
ncbi:hypothetical protein CYMTET_26545 [Cymbomonas tetramitiformis]|uniref:Ubiquitin-like domain-containing protein n=1 Tax=Cymbomonas tetramitiformis TaxID=36881 RepID=A0AAE0FS29_9CHLO|nr:hypothetical protein CYMTET_26545 [Cymbomonas tetramitiformis]|eukprot:gene1108-1662_t